MKRTVSLGLSTLRTQMHVKKTVDEILFKGYEDPIINLMNKMTFLQQPDVPKMDKFGWFYGVKLLI